MAEAIIEHELCANCKKEIPQSNYVMHTVHCARNIALCPICKEPVPKAKLEDHKKRHAQRGQTNGALPKQAVKPAQLNGSPVPQQPKPLPKPQEQPQPKPQPKPQPYKQSLLACKYCDLELPKLDLDDHENYCGSRTDKCNECGELVMFKYKKLHEESNHGFIKLNDEPAPRASWDSTSQRSQPTSNGSNVSYRRSQPFDMTSLQYNMTDYLPPSLMGGSGNPYGRKPEKGGESYKDISRRLDCKTEYIKNLLHDSACITAPLRSSGVAPRNHFNHNKGSGGDVSEHGPAPQPPSRRRNPPTELTIPCEFCDTPIPHEDLIQHETGCRPDLARYNPRRRRSSYEDEYFSARDAPPNPEEQLPCEFCCDLIPASQLLMHQAKCN